MSRKPIEAVSANGFESLQVTVDHAEAVSRLAPHHKNPFDRLLIATAQLEGLTILTSDRMFWRYDVPLLDATR
jgi:PIN domain nuclease of toxin-antitoxin system